MIIKKKGFKKEFRIGMDLNRVSSGLFINKETYNGNRFSVFHLIKDSITLNRQNSSLGLKTKAAELTEVSYIEYEAIKKALLKYPHLTTLYSLNADSIKQYLGWYKIP